MLAHRIPALALRTVVFGALLFTSAVASAKKAAPPPAGADEVYATITTSLGDIEVQLFEKDAPKTVANFIGLATGDKEWTDPVTGKKVKGRSLYAGTTFHRVLPKFMIQGGDPYSNPNGGNAALAGRGGPGYQFEDEFNNGHDFSKPGMLAMANSGPNTNGSQFFITEVPVTYLNGKHTIFGQVTKGQDLVSKIVAAGNGKVQIISVTITRKPAAK